MRRPLKDLLVATPGGDDPAGVEQRLRLVEADEVGGLVPGVLLGRRVADRRRGHDAHLLRGVREQTAPTAAQPVLSLLSVLPLTSAKNRWYRFLAEFSSQIWGKFLRTLSTYFLGDFLTNAFVIAFSSNF